MRITSLLILIGIILFMFIGQTTYEKDIEYGIERDIYNFTESTLKWDYNITKSLNTNVGNDIQILEYSVPMKRFKNVIYKFIDFVGYSSFEGAKVGIEYGYTHPEYDLKFFLDFLIKTLVIGIVIACIPLVIPLIALIYLSFKGIYCLIKKLTKNKNENSK